MESIALSLRNVKFPSGNGVMNLYSYCVNYGDFVFMNILFLFSRWQLQLGRQYTAGYTYFRLSFQECTILHIQRLSYHPTLLRIRPVDCDEKPDIGHWISGKIRKLKSGTRHEKTNTNKQSYKQGKDDKIKLKCLYWRSNLWLSVVSVLFIFA